MNYEKKHMYLTGALIVGISGIFSFFFLPMVVQDIIYNKEGTWFIQAPPNVIKLYLVAFACWTASLLLIYFFWKKAVIPSLLLLVVGVAILVVSINHYKLMSDDEIVWSNLTSFDKHTYPWSEVLEIQSVPNPEGKGYTIKLVFNDGESVSFKRDTNFNANYWKFRDKIAEYNLSYVGVDEE